MSKHPLLQKAPARHNPRHSTSAPAPARDSHRELTPAQALGNQLMQSLQPKPLQPKLSVNAPNDRYEQEADRMASRVAGTADVQRAENAAGMDEEKRDETVQTKPLAS